jgi:hypothetical protein
MNERPQAKRRGWLRNDNTGDFLKAPRCGARTRARRSCRSPAMPNGRCRMHGGASTGPRTAEGLERSRRASLKHGLRSAEMIKVRREAASARRALRDLIASAEQLLRNLRSLRAEPPLECSCTSSRCVVNSGA